MLLLDDILFFPVNGFISLLKAIQDHAEKELYDEDRLKREFLELQLLREANEISGEEYEEREAILLERIKIAHQRRREKEEEE